MIQLNDLVKVKEGFYGGKEASVVSAMAHVDDKGEKTGSYTYRLRFAGGAEDFFQRDDFEQLDKEEWMKERMEENKKNGRLLDPIRRFFAKF